MAQKRNDALEGGIRRGIGIRQEKKLAQSVVSWQEDADISECPLCRRSFSYSLRKHHCRLCGHIVCSDPQSSCSSEIGFNVSSSTIRSQEAFTHLTVVDDSQHDSQSTLDIRMCKDCKEIVFSKRDFVRDTSSEPAFARAYKVATFQAGLNIES